MQYPMKDRQICVGRYDVDVPGLGFHPIFGGQHPHLAGAPQQLGEDAVVIGSEMLHDHKSGGVQNEMLEERSQGFQSARGRAHSNDGELWSF